MCYTHVNGQCTSVCNICEYVFVKKLYIVVSVLACWCTCLNRCCAPSYILYMCVCLCACVCSLHLSASAVHCWLDFAKEDSYCNPQPRKKSCRGEWPRCLTSKVGVRRFCQTSQGVGWAGREAISHWRHGEGKSRPGQVVGNILCKLLLTGFAM